MSVCVCTTCERNCVPSPIKQGERHEWDWTVCDYPADEYDLQIRFRGPGTGFDVDATADGTKFEFDHTFDDAMTVGKWAWQAWVTEIADATNTFEVQSGTMTVEQGFATGSTATVDFRTAAEIALAAIDAQLSGSSTVQEYEIQTPAGSRRVKNFTRKELLDLRKHYALIVSMERTKARLKNGGSLMRSIPINVGGN